MESTSSSTFYLHTWISTIYFYRWIKLSTKRQISLLCQNQYDLYLYEYGTMYVYQYQHTRLAVPPISVSTITFVQVLSYFTLE